MIRINRFRNLALAIGFAAFCGGGSGCAAPTGQDSLGQSDDEVRHAHVVGVDGAWDGVGNGYMAGKGPLAVPLNKPGFASSPSPEPWNRGGEEGSPSPEPWGRSVPPPDDGSGGSSSGGGGENPHPNAAAPSTK